MRVTTGEVLSVMETKSVETGGTMKWTVVWYEVSYGGKKGWLSQHDVDLDFR